MKSDTNNFTRTLDTPVRFIKGVGPKLALVFKSKGIETVQDLLTFFPRTYEDRSKIFNISELINNERATLKLKILSKRKIPTRQRFKNILEVKCSDATGALTLKWFHSPYGVDRYLNPGQILIVSGVPKVFYQNIEIIHPEIEAENTDSKSPSLHMGRIIPIYTEIDGVSTRILRKILWEALQSFAHAIKEDLPMRFLKKYNLPKKSDSIRFLHFPPEDEKYPIEKLNQFDTPSQQRLIYEEFFKFEYIVLKSRLNQKKESSFSINKENALEFQKNLIEQLPYRLTQGQVDSVADILNDLEKPYPMNRLLQGDVGSGKTIVSLLTAGALLSQEYKVSLMAPTEILASQHFKNAKMILNKFFNVIFLSGKSTQKERDKILAALQDESPSLIVGTHALIEPWVKIKNLGLVIIDEQQRFGVHQRMKLRQQNENELIKVPHLLVLSATPIPRTLALTAYGDLIVSSIKELPPGRSPIVTKLLRAEESQYCYEHVRNEILKGRQAYFVYSLIEDSEAEGFENLKSIMQTADELKEEVFPDFKIGILHGKLSAEEKQKIMIDFKENKIHILLSTTVVEVGVDVPNATVMVIENAERFGLSQLHQLRGRVGRGTHQSYCFLIAKDYLKESTEHRLRILEKSNDGFAIAEADLSIRGPGEFLGTRQSGNLPFKVADLVRDQNILMHAREDAIELLKSDPELQSEEYKSFHAYCSQQGEHQLENLKTS